MNEATPSPKQSWFPALMRRLHRKPSNRDELLDTLHAAKNKDILTHDALKMIEGVLEVSHTHVRDIMVPRGQMVVIEMEDSIDTIITNIIESTHSRFPVIGENRDEILGILLAKDLLRYYNKNGLQPDSIRSMIRAPVFVPESKRLNILLREFRINRYHMAMVVDEYGGVSGLVTIEDVLEQIVGNIEDETDITVDEPNIKKIASNVFDIKPLTPIEEFNDYFATQINDNNFDTIAGYIMQAIGHMPKRGEAFEFDNFKLCVTAASKRRIQQLKLIKKN